MLVLEPGSVKSLRDCHHDVLCAFLRHERFSAVLAHYVYVMVKETIKLTSALGDILFSVDEWVALGDVLNNGPDLLV